MSGGDERVGEGMRFGLHTYPLREALDGLREGGLADAARADDEQPRVGRQVRLAEALRSGDHAHSASTERALNGEREMIGIILLFYSACGD